MITARIALTVRTLFRVTAKAASFTLTTGLPLVISILSLGISLYTYHENRLSRLTSNTPFVQIYYQTDETEPIIGIRMANVGSAAAVLCDVEFFQDGKAIGAVSNVRDDARSDYDEIRDQTFFPGDALAANESQWLYYTKSRSNKNGVGFADFVARHLIVGIDFCSLDGRCWKRCSQPNRCGRWLTSEPVLHCSPSLIGNAPL